MAWFDTPWRRIAAISVIVVAAFGIVGAFAIPAAARWGLETVASRELGRTVRVEGISANPYALRVTLRGLKAEAPPGQGCPAAAASTDSCGGESVDPATVAITEQEPPALVATVYSDEKIPDKPRNVIGIAKTLPVPEMEQLILTSLTATSDDMRGLATARAAAVRNHLEDSGKVPRERLFLVEPKLTADGIQDKGSPTRVDFLLK